MIRPLKKSPRQLEWKALEKREERFITAARHQKEPLLNRKLERFVPEKLEDTLNLAFYKAFELIFNRGTSIIEKHTGRRIWKIPIKSMLTPQD